jgi:hypothetical protein
MIRTIAFAAAAIVLTTGTVAALADTTTDQAKVTIAKDGEYCVRTPAITGSIIDRVECHTQQDWAKLGVTFGRR